MSGYQAFSAERVGLLQPSWLPSQRDRHYVSTKIAPGDFPEPAYFIARGFESLERIARTREVTAIQVIEIIGGEGGIRTHVPELPDHPISSRRRYDHFGTSPDVRSAPVRGGVYSSESFC